MACVCVWGGEGAHLQINVNLKERFRPSHPPFPLPSFTYKVYLTCRCFYSDLPDLESYQSILLYLINYQLDFIRFMSNVTFSVNLIINVYNYYTGLLL